MVICVVGPPSAGKTTFIKKYGQGFEQIISDEINNNINNWSKTKEIVREMILNSTNDIIVEIEPECISDLIDYIVEIETPAKPRRKLEENEKLFFYNYEISETVNKKIRLKSKSLKWEMLNKRFSKTQKTPLWKWK